MNVFLAGANLENNNRQHLDMVASRLKLQYPQHNFINPAVVKAVVGEDFNTQMKLKNLLLEFCEAIFFQEEYHGDTNACVEFLQAKELGKKMYFEHCGTCYFGEITDKVNAGACLVCEKRGGIY